MHMHMHMHTAPSSSRLCARAGGLTEELSKELHSTRGGGTRAARASTFGPARLLRESDGLVLQPLHRVDEVEGTLGCAPLPALDWVELPAGAGSRKERSAAKVGCGCKKEISYAEIEAANMCGHIHRHTIARGWRSILSNLCQLGRDEVKPLQVRQESQTKRCHPEEVCGEGKEEGEKVDPQETLPRCAWCTNGGPSKEIFSPATLGTWRPAHASVLPV